ncbi:hybrid sensor histidine kinase/response regulator [Pseudomarimonas salicorniae]|uniref:histidine kinase n=1 Tax=Pseudomarimonas salicorniae TaxID=2933270 RepID=A0ABT0GCE6_9GAMM|nr:hybrid sensor histidine kinase/response regulator [Lysobacter sp. CAU 1642]MCK7592210.1 ATP-binding protein [Lysobacter sp. CAU 1642]
MNLPVVWSRLALGSAALATVVLLLQWAMPHPALLWLALLLAGLSAAGQWLAGRSPGTNGAAPVQRREPVAGDLAGGRRDELLELRSEIERHKALEQELLAAKQAAEAATMAKGEFLATMSHEIRTPLNGIIPLLDILLTSPLGPDQRDYVQTAFGSARQLLRIVDDILDYSKLEASKLELETVGLNLKEVLEGVQRLMEKPAEAKQIGLNLAIDPSVRLAVRGDPVRLRQILTNLVSNAVKFTDRGAVTLSVSRRGETRTHHDLRFEVRDTGCGVAPEAASKLFKPFSQADASTTRTFGGTGLGLVICKRIVDLMGGQIGVESELGKGSVFWFQIPMLKAVGDMGSARHHGLQGSRILVLSSDPQLLRRLSVSIPQWGATPVPASNTQEALTKLRAAANRPDAFSFQLLMVDLNSVRTTALGLHRNLMREGGLEDLRVVYLQGEEPPPEEIVNSDRVLVLPRSSNDAELRQLLGRHLDDPGASTGAAEPDVRVSAPARGAARPLPAAPAARPRPAAPEPAAPAPSPPPGPKLRGHMLLVEDNPVNRQVAQRLLSLSGLTMDCAENGREAVDMSARGRYDAVLMDCQMPVLDGYAATREIREREKKAGMDRIPIIAMTANAMVGDREKCLNAGMDDYLSKPLNRHLLEQTIRKWLMRRAESSPVSVINDREPESSPPARSAPAPQAKPAAARPGPRPAPPPAPPRADPINREVVDDLKEIMGAEFDSLVRVFLEDAPRSIERLRQAAEGKEIDLMVGPAHTLKSTSANLGAMELSAIAKQIEYGARQKNLDEPLTRVAQLEQEFSRADQALRMLLG